MASEKEKVVTALAEIPKMQLVSDTRVANKFVSLFNHVHGSGNGQHIYAVEKFHFEKMLAENKELQTCTNLSLYGAFVDIAVQGLSIDPSRKLAYLYPQSVNVGTKENKKYEKRAQLKISPRGELHLRQMYGQIQHADNPQLVYESDKFSKLTGPTGTIINHESIYPRKTNKIIACFFRFIKADGNIDYGFIDYEGMMRLKGYSARKNFGNANALYSSYYGDPDPGLWEAKCLLHAFDSYPKVKLRGQHSVLETKATETEEIDYGIDGEDLNTQQEAEVFAQAEIINTPPPTQQEQPNTQPASAPTPPQVVSPEIQDQVDNAINGLINYKTVDSLIAFAGTMNENVKNNQSFRQAVLTRRSELAHSNPQTPAAAVLTAQPTDLSEF